MKLGVVHFDLDARLNLLTGLRVDALPKLPGKEVDAHNRENEPEDEAHK